VDDKSDNPKETNTPSTAYEAAHGAPRLRVAIARALSYRPKMLLMDEPFAALDSVTRHEMQDLLTQIWQDHGLTVLFVTHDVEEAMYLSDRFLSMSIAPGQIIGSFRVGLARPRRRDMIASTDLIELQRVVITANLEGSVRKDMEV
jgi:NitT/TauT family transport system ATP-binding protein